MFSHQLLKDRVCRLVGTNRSGWIPDLSPQDADVIVGSRQFALEIGDGGVVVGQLLPDRQRRLVGPPSPRPACPVASQQVADVVVACRQLALESATEGLVVGQLLLDRQRRLERPSSLRPLSPVALSRLPMLLWLAARSALEPATEGWPSASFCWIASAASYDLHRLGRLPRPRSAGCRCCSGLPPVRSGTRRRRGRRRPASAGSPAPPRRTPSPRPARRWRSAGSRGC